MRIAIISDIHGNLEGLETALTIIRNRGVDATVCLGDIVGYGANPNECVENIRAATPHLLLGNHDEASVFAEKSEYFNPYARIAVEWTHDELTEPNREFLRGLPYTLVLENILFVHSSPFDPPEWHYIITQADAEENFPYFNQELCFVGHSHVPNVFCTDGRTETLEHGKRFIVNVGSVGQPRDGDPRLSFGIVDTTAWTYENVRAEYNVDLASTKIKKAGLPKALADRLRLGR